MIVTVTPTQFGPVVTWYTADGDMPLEEIAVASSNTLLILEDVPPDVRDAAQAVHRELSKNRDADMRLYATHIREANGFVPVGIAARVEGMYVIGPEDGYHGAEGLTVLKTASAQKDGE